MGMIAADYLRTVAFTSTMTLRSLTGSAACEIDQRLAALQDDGQALVDAGRPLSGVSFGSAPPREGV